MQKLSEQKYLFVIEYLLLKNDFVHGQHAPKSKNETLKKFKLCVTKRKLVIRGFHYPNNKIHQERNTVILIILIQYSNKLDRQTISLYNNIIQKLKKMGRLKPLNYKSTLCRLLAYFVQFLSALFNFLVLENCSLGYTCKQFQDFIKMS